MRGLELSVLVDEDAAREMLLELANDPRVQAITLSLGDGKYVVPDHSGASTEDDS